MWLKKLNCILSTLFLSLNLQASVVNVESLRTSLKDQIGIAGTIDTSLEYLRGNNEVTNISLNSAVQYRANSLAKNTYVLFGNIRLGEKQKEKYLNNGMIHLRWIYHQTNLIQPETFAQLQYDDFKSLTSRFVIGTGQRFNLITSKKIAFALGSGYMFEAEKLNVSTIDSHPESTRHHRWNNYISLTWSILPEKISFSNIIYYQPRFDEFSDFRLIETTQLEFTVTQNISLVLALSISHDSNPPDQIKLTDTKTLSKIRVKL